MSKSASAEKKPRGRQPGFIMSNEHRDKIRNSNILNALIEHVEGQRDMSASQVTAGLGLLKKAMPDLQSVTHSGDPDNPLDVNVRLNAERFTSAITRLAARSGTAKGS